ncbi:MAG: UDP-N-acetylmuramoyl-L-alanine--D-glutamate ligase, partial [Acidobacteriota bacterium]
MKGPWTAQPLSRVLVYGLGASGLAAARLLRAHGVAVVGVDRRPAAELEAELAGLAIDLRAGGEPAALPAGIDAVVVSPGVPASRPLLAAARAAGLPVLAEVELAFPFLNGPLIGITGSNGKSTTTALTGELLRRAGFAVEVCGNIGRPLASCVEGPPGRVFVVELSSFQLETIATLRPRAAAVLNVSPDHLDRHGSLQAYAAAKLRLLQNQHREDVAVLNAEDPLVADAPTAARRRRFALGGPVDDGCFLDSGAVVEARPGEPLRELFRPGDLPLVGLHNLENAMAAALLALALGAEPVALAAG